MGGAVDAAMRRTRFLERSHPVLQVDADFHTRRGSDREDGSPYSFGLVLAQSVYASTRSTSRTGIQGLISRVCERLHDSKNPMASAKYEMRCLRQHDGRHIVSGSLETTRRRQTEQMDSGRFPWDEVPWLCLHRREKSWDSFRLCHWPIGGSAAQLVLNLLRAS